MSGSSFDFLENKVKDLASTDKEFRKNLIANPKKKALKEKFNVAVPDGVDIKVVEDTSKTVYLVLPPVIGENEIGFW